MKIRLMKIQKTTAQVLLTLGLLCYLSVSQAQGKPNIGSIGGVADGICSEAAVLRQWLHLKAVVLAMHGRLLAEHGGAPRIRDPALLDSALARPQHLLAYGDPDIYDLAAAYTSEIVRNHPFVDGNKRTGFMAAYVFLASNELQLTATEVDVVQVVTLLAASEIGESEYAAWLRENCQSI